MFTFHADRLMILALILDAVDAANNYDDARSEELLEEATAMVKAGLSGDVSLSSYNNTDGVSWEVYSADGRVLIGEIFWTRMHGRLVVECCQEEI
jgi:hypothetical protein